MSKKIINYLEDKGKEEDDKFILRNNLYNYLNLIDNNLKTTNEFRMNELVDLIIFVYNSYL
jgi:hypothetical protein